MNQGLEFVQLPTGGTSRPASPSRIRLIRNCYRWLAAAALLVLCVVLSGCIGGFGGFLPFIVDVNPKTVSAGSPAVAVVITGRGFASSVLLVNGQPVAPTQVTPTAVNATIPASFFSQPGTVTLVIMNALPSQNATSNSVTITITGSSGVPSLAITKSHTGNFTLGQIGATYTVTVSNIASNGTTSGTVTVTDMLPPAGLTITNMAGNGWICTVTIASCDRSDALAPGMSYPAITITVNVATNAPATVTNQVTVTGGGSAPATASDPTTINSAGAPAFTIGAQTNSPTFPPGGTGAYTITITNSGTAATTGTITLTVMLSSGLTPGSLTDGSEWSCNTTMLTCTTTISLMPGQSFNTITLDVVISPTAPATVSATFTVAGDGATAMITVTTPT